MYIRWTATWAKKILLPVFLLFRLTKRDTGNEVDHVSNVQPIDDNQAGAKSTLNLMKLMSPTVYFYQLHGQLTWHRKILQCTKNGLLMSTRVLKTRQKYHYCCHFISIWIYVGKNSFYIAFGGAMFKVAKEMWSLINTASLVPPPGIFKDHG